MAAASLRPPRFTTSLRCLFILGTLIIAALALFEKIPVFLVEDIVHKASPWSGLQAKGQDIATINDESVCLLGVGEIPTTGITIPNVVHFVFILDRNPGVDFNFINYLAVRSAMVNLAPTAIYVHHSYIRSPLSLRQFNDPKNSPWLRRLLPHIRLVHHAAISHVASSTALDVFGLQIMYELGGIYMDLDTVALRPFTSLMDPPSGRDVVISSQSDVRSVLNTGIIAARPKSEFLGSLLKRYEAGMPVSPNDWATQQPKQVCKAPSAVLPSATTWHHITRMHEKLDANATTEFDDQLSRRNGAMFNGQLAYHFSSTTAWRRYLHRLTPEVVRNENTRFNLLVRRFLEVEALGGDGKGLME